MVERIDYYRVNRNDKMDVIDIAFSLSREEGAAFCRWNIYKYFVRSGRKPGAESGQDLAKARTYLERWREHYPSTAPGTVQEVLEGIRDELPITHDVVGEIPR